MGSFEIKDETESEIEIFQKLAHITNETLEDVYRMTETEREQLISVFELRKDKEHAEKNKSTVPPLVIDADSDISVVSNPVKIKMADEQAAIPDVTCGNILADDVSNDDDAANDGEPANVNSRWNLLQQDAERVWKLLGPEERSTRTADEVLAYLEAHIENKHRVEIVVGELSKVIEDHQTLERQPSEEDTFKGKGISTKSFNPVHENKRKQNVFCDPDSPSKRPRLDVAKGGIEESPGYHVADLPTKGIFNFSHDVDKGPSPVAGLSRKGKVISTEYPSEITRLEVSKAEGGTSVVAMEGIPSFSNDIVKEDQSRSVAELVSYFSSMFPKTPVEYLKFRSEDLAGKESALERFTDELLENPVPPANWKQLYGFNVQFRSNSNLTPARPKEANLANPQPSGSGLQVPVPLASVDTPEERFQSWPSLSGMDMFTTHAESPIYEWEKDKHSELISLFPNLCPLYLERQIQLISRSEGNIVARDVTGDDNAQFETFVTSLWGLNSAEMGKLPTRDQWKKQKKEREELERWSSKMTPADFLDIYDDPATYFYSRDRKVSQEYKQHVLAELKSMFRYSSNPSISKCFGMSNFLLAPAAKLLTELGNTRKTRRTDHECRQPMGRMDINFLKEKKFLELADQIKVEKDRRDKAQEHKIEAARLVGSLLECECCYNPDCLNEEMVSCGGGHMYCKECVVTSTKVAMGEGKTTIECLGQCLEEINWQELTRVLQPNVLSKLIQKRQAEEVEQAGLEGVVACPFCPYQTIMENDEDRVLVCRDPDCGRESCRLCREPNHVPLRCEEVEKGDEIRKRIEEQLTEAMLRECVKCKNKFFKVEGCNKMTCKCGAKMCYICKKPVTGYDHFYGQEGTPTDTKTCPLMSDSKVIHEKDIAEAAAKAKQELQDRNLILANDPDKAMPSYMVNEDDVRSGLFAKWFQVFGRVEGMVDSQKKRSLQASMEGLRLLIEGKIVISQYSNIMRQLDNVTREVARGQH